jgi:hypothetical protein
VDSVLSIDVILEISFTVGGERGGKGPAARLYPLSEMRGALFDPIGGIFFCEESGNSSSSGNRRSMNPNSLVTIKPGTPEAPSQIFL